MAPSRAEVSMYYNVFGERVSRRRFKEMCNAAKNRRELIAAGLTSRRDLFKMGLLTAGGMLVAKSGLSARVWGQQSFPAPASSGSNQSPGSFNLCVPGNQTASPATQPFIDPLPIMPTASTVPVSTLSPAPTICPNTSSGTDGTEVRAACHQAPALGFPFPPPRVYKFTQQQFTVHQTSVTNFPVQTISGFNHQFHRPISPRPTFQAHYGTPQMTRNINGLPPVTQKN